jgi:hypothetical protein
MTGAAVFLAALAALTLVSCAKDESPMPTLIEQMSPTPDLSDSPPSPEEGFFYSETFELGSASLFASASFPGTGVTAIDEYYASELEGFKADAAALADEMRLSEFASRPSLEYSESSEIIRDGGGVLSVRRELYTYTGGAHEGLGITCDNFRLPDGARLTLDDVFTAPREEYTQRLLAVFDHYIGENGDGLFFPDAKETLRESFPYDRFCIADDGLIFYFPPYIIGPFAAGIIEIPAEWSELADIADAEISARRA